MSDLSRDAVLGMLKYIRKRIALSKSKEEALEYIDMVIQVVEEEAEAEFLRRFGLRI